MVAYSVLYTQHASLSPKIIGYLDKSIIVWASNTKMSLTSEITTSPNVKPVASGHFKPCMLCYDIVLDFYPVKLPTKSLG